MGIVNIEDELHEQLRRASKASYRSINGQAAFWIRIGMLCELNPHLTFQELVARELREAGVDGDDPAPDDPKAAKAVETPAVTIDNEDQLEKLRAVGGVVARTLAAMGAALEPGMTTKELDDIGRALLEKDGARSAPELTYNFPGATCISVGPDCAHGIPGDTVIKAGDLINIDVSAELDGYFGDTGASFAVPPTSKRIERLCRDGRRAMWAGIRAVQPGARLNAIGGAIETFAEKNGYSLVRNLASHGVGLSLHDEPREIPTWREPRDRRTIPEGLVFTIEPFLSLGADWVEELDDGWTLRPPRGQPTVQYEHTLVATRNGPLVLTLA